MIDNANDISIPIVYETNQNLFRVDAVYILIKINHKFDQNQYQLKQIKPSNTQ